jgi:hypothetical protein
MPERQVPPESGGSNPTPSLQFSDSLKAGVSPRAKDDKADIKANPSSPKSSSLQKTPFCRLLTAKEANIMLDQWHYLGAVTGILFSVGHDEGCCVFTNCRSRIYEKKHTGVVELARMVGMPDHKWAMSSLMAQAARECKRRGYTEIITYADPWNHNTGKVYLSAGWTRIGETAQDMVYMLDGERISRRTMYDRHGTQSRAVVKKIYGDRLKFEIAPPKPIFRKTL